MKEIKKEEMKLQSMTDFVLQGIDDINKSETPIPDRLIITGYARFLQTELKPEHFDPKNPECLFEGFKVTEQIEPEEEINHIIVENKGSFHLGWDIDNDIQFDSSNDDISVSTIEDLISFCDNYGYTIPELTDYSLSKFL